jgi:hypothetical protein
MTFFKKKKRKPGPSKNEEKIRRAQAAQAEERAAGTVAERFPSVRQIVLKLSVSTPQGVVLSEASETYGPDDAFQFEADCPGSCGSGNYDFGPILADALQNARASGTAQIICAEQSYGGGPGGTCGCVARCDFTVS